jgi:hypothetical protein
MHAYFRTFALLASTLASTAAYADAIVSATSGGFLVSQGHGFTRATEPTKLKAGDKVMVTQGNGANITYPDSCTVDVRPGAVHIVGPVSPCAMGQAPIDLTDRCRRARDEEERRRLRCPVVAGAADYTAYGVAAGVIILGGAAAAIALSEGDNNKPVSP